MEEIIRAVVEYIDLNKIGNNGLIVIKSDHLPTSDETDNFKSFLKGRVTDGTLVIFRKHGDEIETLSESVMAEHGWVKTDVSKELMIQLGALKLDRG